MSMLNKKKKNGNAPTISTIAPTALDDITKGYSIGDRWIVKGTSDIYDCTDNAIGAAVWTASGGGGGSGEVNTASNVGTVGIGVFNQKTGVNLEYKKLNPSSKLTIVDDVGNSKLDFDVSEPNIVHDNLSGTGTNTHAQIDAHIASSSNPHSVTKVQVGLGDVPNLKSNLNGTSAPITTNDSTEGYSVGSTWIDTTNNKHYICVDSTASAAVWNDTGTGPVGMTWRGAWSSLTSYVVDDAVEDGGASYICISANTNQQPPNISYWELLADKGGMDINGLTVDASPDESADYVATYDADAGTNKKVLLRDIPHYSIDVSSSVMTSTTSSTYITINSMEYTPVAGTYYVSFSTCGTLTSASAMGNYAIFVNSTIQTNTERMIGLSGGPQVNGYVTSLSTYGKITVNGTDIITIKFKTSSGTFEIHHRTMLLIKL